MKGGQADDSGGVAAGSWYYVSGGGYDNPGQGGNR